MAGENKRSVVLINKRFQFGLIARFLVVNIAILSVYGGFLFLFMDNEVQSNLYSAHVTYKNMKNMLLPIVLTLSVLNMIISSIIIGLFVLFISHRIAGPLYRFKAVVHEICERNIQAFLELRKTDELYPLTETLQEITDLLKSDAEQIKKIQLRIKEINQNLGSEELDSEIKKLESIVLQYQY